MSFLALPRKPDAPLVAQNGRHTIPNPKRKPNSERWSPETANTPMPKPTGYGTRPHPLTFHIYTLLHSSYSTILSVVCSEAIQKALPTLRITRGSVHYLGAGTRATTHMPRGAEQPAGLPATWRRALERRSRKHARVAWRAVRANWQHPSRRWPTPHGVAAASACSP